MLTVWQRVDFFSVMNNNIDHVISCHDLVTNGSTPDKKHVQESL